MKARNFPFLSGYSAHLLIHSVYWVFLIPHPNCFAFFLSSAFFHLPGLKTLDKLTLIRCVSAGLHQTEVQRIQSHLWYSTPRGNIHKCGPVYWDKCLFLPEILLFPTGLVRCNPFICTERCHNKHKQLKTA